MLPLKVHSILAGYPQHQQAVKSLHHLPLCFPSGREGKPAFTSSVEADLAANASANLFSAPCWRAGCEQWFNSGAM